MSLRRLNHLLMAGVLPFNFGMDFEACVSFYDANHEGDLKELCPSNPRSWSPETVAEVNRTAAEETQLYDRLMALPEEEFHAEVERLRKEKQ